MRFAPRLTRAGFPEQDYSFGSPDQDLVGR
jgi:hypothetical protein